MKPLVVVTGKNGQLGWELQQLAESYSAFDFLFVDRSQLDLSNPDSIGSFFAVHKPKFFVNCAAYTAVDKAETEREMALTVNAVSVGEIAKQCAVLDIPLITISTDYVFNGLGADGNASKAYLPDSTIDPVNYYGFTKAEGERLALSNHRKAIVIRTSWVYSTHGNNFVKTMLRLMGERPEIKVVADQKGSPTYAADLAKAIIQVILELLSGNEHYGIYQYSNQGIISWFEFALAIRKHAALTCAVEPIPSSAYPTPAKRPSFSGMDTQAIEETFGVKMIDWEDSLIRCLQSFV